MALGAGAIAGLKFLAYVSTTLVLSDGTVFGLGMKKGRLDAPSKAYANSGIYHSRFYRAWRGVLRCCAPGERDGLRPACARAVPVLGLRLGKEPLTLSFSPRRGEGIVRGKRKRSKVRDAFRCGGRSTSEFGPSGSTPIPASLLPVAIGSAYAGWATGVFHWGRFWVALLAAACITPDAI